MAEYCNLDVYSFLHVAAVLDGREIKGFWEGDDAIQIAPRTDIMNEVVGVDGSGIGSITADRSVLITLRLQSTSPTHKYLENKHRRQRNGIANPMHISIRNKSNHEGGNSRLVLIKTAPRRDFGANAVSRDWVLWAQCWDWNQVRMVA